MMMPLFGETEFTLLLLLVALAYGGLHYVMWRLISGKQTPNNNIQARLQKQQDLYPIGEQYALTDYRRP